MFARVNYNRSIRHTLEYHEKKLRVGKAECLLAENFLKDPERLTLKDKLHRFQRLNSLNEKTRANTLHVSLSLHPTDMLDNQRMKQLAQQYMSKLGLDQQPWLAYRHYDTGHPHLHIVSSLIKVDGSRAQLRDILSHKSRKITWELEKEFNLARFHRQEALSKQMTTSLNSGPPRKLIYGEPHRKQAVEQVLEHVLGHYQFASFSEYNAVLRLYNVKAKVVWEDKARSRARGLVYSTLNERGQAIGLHFKSSSFPSRPTLTRVEQQFNQNRAQRLEGMDRVKQSIDWVFAGKPTDWESFRKSLMKEKIQAVLGMDGSGNWKTIHYVDVSTRSVYDGALLGERYSNQSIIARVDLQARQNQEQTQTIKFKKSIKL